MGAVPIPTSVPVIYGLWQHCGATHELVQNYSILCREMRQNLHSVPSLSETDPCTLSGLPPVSTLRQLAVNFRSNSHRHPVILRSTSSPPAVCFGHSIPWHMRRLTLVTRQCRGARNRQPPPSPAAVVPTAIAGGGNGEGRMLCLLGRGRPRSPSPNSLQRKSQRPLRGVP